MYLTTENATLAPCGGAIHSNLIVINQSIQLNLFNISRNGEKAKYSNESGIRQGPGF